MQSCLSPLLKEMLSGAVPKKLGAWKNDSPKILSRRLLEKLNSVAMKAVDGANLRHDTSCNLNCTIVAHQNHGTDRQFSSQLDGGSVPIEIGRSSGHCEWSLQIVFA